MKFTKEEAVKELAAKYAKPKYGEPEKWQRTIEECVDHAMKLIGDNSDVELAQFADSVLPFLNTAAGFVLKETSDLASGYNKQIEELKKKAEEKKDPEHEDPNDALLKRIEALEKEKEEQKRNAAVSEKKSQIAEKLKSKGVKNKDFIDLLLQKSSIGEDTDADKEADDLLAIYNKIHASGGVDDEPPGKSEGEPSAKIKKTIDDAAKIVKDRIV